ncbi:MAG: hypothetical protein A2428_10545 [Bdellovibrionales bacterium RIFOXYC1_FULL_54_43]|nr:MAG: hypothetical protein A2428_10545 [Bdellovibrionales bacterium RIFOXYC1_FULL_54_43]OFZ81990.1 MAG: hypothetical protein A2603_08625 [Bdellovibrionales bacterium RIFOXYD1_FULL_55_31]
MVIERVDMDNQQFRRLLEIECPDWSLDIREKIVEFRELVLKESQTQNLTRLLSPEEFLEGHVRDVRVLLAQNFLEWPALDLGSGVGVPGLLAALVREGAWILCESEKKKADFLNRAAKQLGLADRVGVVPDRAEFYLKNASVRSIVARAVGPIERIYGWIRSCSTWNNLVLLKGPAWEQEWKDFQKGKFRRELQIVKSFAYELGPDRKSRIIVRLNRVPRGTHNSQR